MTCFRYVDYMLLMAYNFHGSWENYTAHHSTLLPSRFDTEEGRQLCQVNNISFNVKWTFTLNIHEVRDDMDVMKAFLTSSLYDSWFAYFLLSLEESNMSLLIGTFPKRLRGFEMALIAISSHLK